MDRVIAEALVIQFAEDGDLGGNQPRLQRRQEEDDITDLNQKTKSFDSRQTNGSYIKPLKMSGKCYDDVQRKKLKKQILGFPSDRF